ncbi:MAG: heme lyase CcmF/NrfE family subunit [Litorimonas sp.]
MIAEIGHFALILALFVAMSQAVIPAIGTRKDSPVLMNFGRRAAVVQCALLGFAFFTLTLVFVGSDFSVKLAASHSHSAKPLLYKISGVWGNHEGSILLWTVMIGIYSAVFACSKQDLPDKLRALTLACQGGLSTGFIAFILFTSNPFERLFPTPIDGNGLNPVLQDPGLAIHPPMLYLGYVGFSIAFSMAVAALILGKVDKDWAKWLRPWTMAAWSFLTLGIMLGSLWAYYELGWGGWWVWDPVENVSFMPWLLGTALIHSIMVLDRKTNLAHWTVLLAISTFSMSLIGTFVVRSGILVSVHAFAVDPARGVFILALLVAATGGALTLYALRAKTLFVPAEFERISKDGGLVLNNMLLATATFTVFLGTFYPLFIDAVKGSQISVGAPYFEATFAPIMTVLIIFMGAAPLLKWRKSNLSDLKVLRPSLILITLGIVTATVIFKTHIFAFTGLGLALYLALSSIIAIGRRTQWTAKLLAKQSVRYWGFFIAHMGVAILTTGVVSMSSWSHEAIGRLKPGDTLTNSGYEFTLQNPSTGRRENYEYLGANIRVTRAGKPVKTLYTEQRFYPVRDMVTTEAGFDFTPAVTIFAAIGEGNNDDGYIIRANYQPLVTWIWFGAFLMSMAGFISLFGGIKTADRQKGRA